MNHGFTAFYICFIVTKEQILNFLQKKRDSKRNLFLKIKNIICYYQTRTNNTKSVKHSSKHHMLLPNLPHVNASNSIPVDFKTSYVITKQGVCGVEKEKKFQNIICYYQTKRNCIKLTLTIISKHHMLLPNPRF